jgi:hypothetical protein
MPVPARRRPLVSATPATTPTRAPVTSSARYGYLRYTSAARPGHYTGVRTPRAMPSPLQCAARARQSEPRRTGSSRGGLSRRLLARAGSVSFR